MGKKDKSTAIPTSGGAREQSHTDALSDMFRDGGFERPRGGGWGSFAGYLLAGVIGALAGIVALFAAFSGALRGVPLLDRFDIASLLSPTTPITIERTERVTVQAEERIAEIVHRITPVLFGVYAKKDLSADLSGLLKSSASPRAHAISLTSDGWVLAAGELSVADAGDLLLVGFDGRVHPILQRAQDPSTGVWFLKVDTSTFVSAPLYGNSSPLSPDTQVVVASFRVGNAPLVHAQSIAGIVTLPYRDADRLEARVRLPLPLTGAFAGAPLVNMTGEVVALVSAVEGGSAFAVPIAHIAGVLDQVFKNGVIERPTVGAHYIELSNVADAAFPLTRGRRQGALLVKNGAMPAVTPGSSAAAAGLKEGDIIIKVEGELVREESDLASLLLSYPSTATVKLTVAREGEERLIDLKLTPPPSPASQKK